ncbi:MAG: transglycosylase SLT domain-containing protein [Oligoflexia bacterium]|nr:transglycosylase SLT domain-containing protein [Oligoflexia bacterium]
MGKILFLASLILLLEGCATYTSSSLGRSPNSSAKNVEADFEAGDIEKILEETNPVLSESDGKEEKIPLKIPIEINKRVSDWIQYFTVRERAMTQRYFERGEPLKKHIQAILKENDVPQELYYLAMIESGFVTSAKSRAKAVGVWQFMPGTGKNYGLSLNNNIDERRNWIKSTEAAASYLKDLNNVFGSWYLALAAYNAGEHRIVRSIMKGKTRDFWALAEAGLLPKETLNYVPKFLAAHIVGKNMARFGFSSDIEPENEWEPFETVSVPSGARLSDISKATKVPLSVLKRWNSDLLKGRTYSSKEDTVDIYVPQKHIDAFKENEEKLAKLSRPNRSKTKVASSKDQSGREYDIYVVRRGDNLSAISKKIGVSSRTIMKVNGLRKSRIHPGQRLRYYKKDQSTSVQKEKRAVASNKSKVSTSKKSNKKKK